MICNMDKMQLVALIKKQLDNFFICNSETNDIIINSLDVTLTQIELGFRAIKNKYYLNEYNQVTFSTNHADQYSLFIFRLLNNIYARYLESKNSNELEVTEQLYSLNRIMNSVNWFYAIDLPIHFGCEHPIGSILGRAEYGEYLYIFQGVTIGGSFDAQAQIDYPIIGENVICFANSRILGASRIGNNVILGEGTQVINKSIPDNSIVFGKGNDIIIKPNKSKIDFWSL